MQVEWAKTSVLACLSVNFTGEWGDEPNPSPSNARVLRSTNLDDDGHVDLAGGAPRLIPRTKLVAKQLRHGDILLEASGGGPGRPVGRVAAFRDDGNGPYLCSNFFRALRPAEHANSGFLAWRLLYLHRQPSIWHYQQQTTGIINLKYEDYLAQEILLPPLPEQRRIAEILDTLDEAIRKTEHVIAKLQQMKQGLLHDLLTRGLDENGELRDPYRHPEQFQDSPLGRIPKAWEVAPLDRLLSLTYRYPSYYGIEYVSAGVPEVRGELVHADGSLDADPSNYRRISEATAAKFPKVRLEPGDFVMTVRGTIGKIATVPALLAGAVITANLLRLSPARDSVDVEWMRIFLLSPPFQFALDLACSATTIKTIQVPALLAIPVAVPPLAEQREMAAVFDGAERRLTKEQAQLHKLRTLKQGLMDDLLTGRVRVSVSEESHR